MVGQTLEQFDLPPDIVMQVTEMTRVAIDKALKQLTANGGAAPVQHRGYQFQARSAEELRGVPATKKLVSDSQPIETGEPEPDRGPTPSQQIVVPKETKDGWAF